MSEEATREEDRLRKLLFPDLLADEELIEILSEYGTSVKYEHLSRDELLDLFKRVAQPKPRRIKGGPFTSRHRGPDKEGSANYCSIQPQNGRKKLLIENSSPPKTMKQSRLKPPVQAVNFERKVIKLNSSKSNPSGLDKIVIKDKSKDVKKVDEGVSKRPIESPISETKCKRISLGDKCSASQSLKSPSQESLIKKAENGKASTEETTSGEKKTRHPRITFDGSTSSDKKIKLKRTNFSASSNPPQDKMRKVAS